MTNLWRRTAAVAGLLLVLPLMQAAPASAHRSSGELLIRLISLYAADISESGHDELYMLRSGNGLVWPSQYPGISTAQNDCIVFDSSRAACPPGSNVRAAGDQNINWANLTAAPNEQLTLELQEEDLVGDDKLGSVRITAVAGRSWELTWAKSGDFEYRFAYSVTTNPWP
ncbi:MULTISPECIES: hypothetical protein [Streptosporangium]|uniref:Uncharacterized protein n=1 Tax=Streptosporangium brasiliense TaxID=47480 RepID=A0ABT9RJ85_9ACTN|nr:hypothetical protein [Streptosporangium brasiliense]MDP9869354.1 hypothetical protein [Streptosporangium brasiliense]